MLMNLLSSKLFNGEAVIEGFTGRLDEKIDLCVTLYVDLAIYSDDRDSELIGVHLLERRDIVDLNAPLIIERDAIHLID
jgi:hypothetical protein